MDQIRGLLQQYIGGDPGQASPDIHGDFDQVAQTVPQGALANGIASAIRSDQTPDFGQIASQLFNNGNGQQRAGLLNSILPSVAPGLLSQVLGGSGLSGLLGGGQSQVSPQQADGVSPNTVQQLASHAVGQDGSVIDAVSQFVSGHPDLVKSLGGGMLGTVLSKIGQL